MYIIKVKIHPVSDVTIEGWIDSNYGRCDRIKDAKWFPEATAAYKFIEILIRKWECTRKQCKVDFEIYEPDGNDLLNDLLEDEPDHDVYKKAAEEHRKACELGQRLNEMIDRSIRIDDMLTECEEMIREIRENLEAAK